MMSSRERIVRPGRAVIKRMYPEQCGLRISDTHSSDQDEEFEHIDEEMEENEPGRDDKRQKNETPSGWFKNQKSRADTCGISESGCQASAEEENNDWLKARVRNLSKELEKKNAENESLRDDKERLTKQVERLTAHLNDVYKQKDCLDGQLRELKEPKRNWLSSFKRQASSSATSTSRLYIPRKQVHYARKRPTQNVNNVDAVIMERVQERLSKQKLELHELPWKQDKSHVPSVVFCVYASRLGTDVEEVLPDLKESPLILVILHPVLVKRQVASTLSSAGHLLPRNIKSKVSSVLHFAFSKTEGLYNCKPNDTALKNFAEILERFPGTAL